MLHNYTTCWVNMTGLPKELFGAQGRFGYEILQASFSNELVIATQSMDLHAQSMHGLSFANSDRYFAQQSIDLLPNPWIVHALGTLRKLWIKQTRFCFVLRLLLISGHAKPASYS